MVKDCVESDDKNSVGGFNVLDVYFDKLWFCEFEKSKFLLVVVVFY